MKLVKVFLLILGLVALSGTVSAQSGTQSYEDWNYDKSGVKEREVIPYRYTGEVNVKYMKRIHRVLDTREKKNKIMAWPRSPFYKLIYENVMNGKLTPYKDYSLDSIYTPEDVLKLGTVSENATIQDPMFPDDPYALIDTTIVIPFEPSYIVKYRIMEDWIFDAKYSDLKCRIICLAPLYKPVFAGIEVGEQAMYWIKFEELRPLMVKTEVFNPYNDAARLSYDDFFEMRMFSSYIVKESNMYDSDIDDYEEFKDNGVKALLESDRIKNDLFIMEHDVWEY